MSCGCYVRLVWGFNQITGATKREVGERRSTCFCVVFASANMYNWCWVVCSVIQDLHGFAIQWPQVVCVDGFFKVPQGCACNASFCRCGAKWSVDFLFLKWDDLDVMQTRYRTDVDVDIHLETNYNIYYTRFIYLHAKLCAFNKNQQNIMSQQRRHFPRAPDFFCSLTAKQQHQKRLIPSCLTVTSSYTFYFPWRCIIECHMPLCTFCIQFWYSLDSGQWQWVIVNHDVMLLHWQSSTNQECCHLPCFNNWQTWHSSVSGINFNQE